jgi:hypothetical protein
MTSDSMLKVAARFTGGMAGGLLLGFSVLAMVAIH